MNAFLRSTFTCGLCLSLAACGAKSRLDVEQSPNDDAAGRAGASHGSAGTTSGNSSQAAGASSGGSGQAGAAESGAGGEPGEIQCVTAQDCFVDNACSQVTCRSSRCFVENRPLGTVVHQNVPADCHATACDAQGQVMSVIDLKNVPKSAEPCLRQACASDGSVTEKPSGAGTPCTAEEGGQVCDGSGKCVACLTSADCATGSCVQHRCVAPACSNGIQDGSETDIDCGGTCLPCVETQSCQVDQDCTSDSCEPLRLTCLPNSCLDGVQNQLETDVDCGGADCSPCYTLAACVTGQDCATGLCDAAKLICIGNACADRRLDGPESDVDCGGFDCPGCEADEHCRSSFDCAGGLYCTRLPGRAFGTCLMP